MSYDLSEYHHLKNEIAELKAEIGRLKSEHRKKMKNQASMTSLYRVKWRLEANKNESALARAIDAIKTIKSEGRKVNIAECCRIIANEVNLKAQTVRTLWYKDNDNETQRLDKT